MSTLQSKHEVRQETVSGDHAPGTSGSGWQPFSPVELAAISAVQAHAVFVWLVVLAGLSGFRPQALPAATTGWAFASARLAGLGSCLSATSALAPKPAPSEHSA